MKEKYGKKIFEIIDWKNSVKTTIEYIRNISKYSSDIYHEMILSLKNVFA